VNVLPNVAELLTLEDHPNPDVRCIRVSLKPAPVTAEDLAQRLAVNIVFRLTEPAPDEFARWYAHLTSGAPLSGDDKAVLLAYVGADFEDPDDQTRREGAVVEHLWAAIAEELDGGWGTPKYVEHDHFSVIDHGPDGLSLYAIGQPTLAFRLWESKRHATPKAVTKTVTTATRQLRDHGVQYLARVSKVLQVHEDPEVAQLGGTIVRAWQEDDDARSIGVSVGRSAGQALPNRPFVGMRRHFAFADKARREAGGFKQWARRVVPSVRRGCPSRGSCEVEC
jgi:hypothetical protein